VSKITAKKTPLKKCPDCQKQSHARIATCKCGFVFYKKKCKNKTVKDWKSLKEGDVVRSVYGYGPYWENPQTKDKTYMGDYGKIIVKSIGKDYVQGFEYSRTRRCGTGRTVYLYMGVNKRSDLMDNLYSCPHKLIGISLKGES
jgi:hypothetical protein